MELLFKLLAPMRNVAAIENCARGIEAMAREEAAYWLGMAMHRKNPRRVLASQPSEDARTNRVEALAGPCP